MNIKLNCIKKKLKRECFNKEYNSLNEEIKEREKYIKVIDEKQNELNKSIKEIKLESLLNIDIKYLDEDEIEYEYNKKSNGCNLMPDRCELEVQKLSTHLNNLKIIINRKVTEYNRDLDVIYMFQTLYLEEDREIDDTYFNFNRDREDNLIFIFFDIANFVSWEDGAVKLYSYHEKTSDLYKDYLKYDGHSLKLDLKYERKPTNYCLYKKEFKSKGYILICDFNSKHRNLGHGTFAISNLEPIINNINDRINIINKNIDYNDRLITNIIAINGLVSAGSGISHDELVAFYNKNGYPTVENNRYIYKEI